jgi:hypothetical protein
MTGTFAPSLGAISSLQLIIFLLVLSFYTLGQELPQEIRGYKVQRASIDVVGPSGEPARSELDASISFGDPKLTQLSVTGLTFELEAEAKPMAASGTIEFLTFYDFQVNGIRVTVEDYSGPLQFRRNQTVKLPKPIKISIGRAAILQAAWNELTESKTTWTVTGRVFVFARFRKFGMSFKRVVPFDVRLSIRNPVSPVGNSAPTSGLL